jgi:NAD(P)-dependent dehydrogenase (short-subunit alcohol dehydrogenase family)
MAEQGARVVILDLARADPEAAAARIGKPHLGLVADVTDKAACEAAAAKVVETFGRIDVLVNNAGITQPVKTLEITGADYDRILDVSLRGHASHVAGGVADDAAPEIGLDRLHLFGLGPARRAASLAGRTTRPRRRACLDWPAQWHASSVVTASA